MIIATLMGLLAGLICSLGGALKDSPYEGFSPIKFPRSLIVGMFWGFVSHWITSEPVVSFVFSGYLERATVEGWKIIRAQKPGKFELKDPEKLGGKLGFRKVA